MLEIVLDPMDEAAVQETQTKVKEDTSQEVGRKPLNNLLQRTLNQVEADMHALKNSGTIFRNGMPVPIGTRSDRYQVEFPKAMLSTNPMTVALEELLTGTNSETERPYWNNKHFFQREAKGVLGWGQEQEPVAYIDLQDRSNPQLFISNNIAPEEILKRAEAVLRALDPVVKQELAELNSKLYPGGEDRPQRPAEMAAQKAYLEGIIIK